MSSELTEHLYPFCNRRTKMHHGAPSVQLSTRVQQNSTEQIRRSQRFNAFVSKTQQAFQAQLYRKPELKTHFS